MTPISHFKCFYVLINFQMTYPCRTAFASWLLGNILLLNVPRYGAYMMMLTGALMILSVIIFWCLKPVIPLAMRFEEVIITFRLGWCFWITLVVGKTKSHNSHNRFNLNINLLVIRFVKIRIFSLC